jgi:MFS family permease
MLADASGSRLPFFQGWLVVAGVFITLLVTSGLGFYNASVILAAAVDELDASVSVISGATAVFFGTGGITGFLIAPFMERLDIRWFLATGGVLGAAAMWSLEAVNSVFGLYLFFIALGFAWAFAGLVPGTTLVARWFDKRRSVALSIASTGLSFGGIALTPIIAGVIDDKGLAGSARLMAVIWFVGIVPASLLLVRSSPGEVGLEPDGAPSPPVPKPVVGATLAQATASRFFRGLCATYALVFMAQVGAIAHLFKLATERVGSSSAEQALIVIALSSVSGRLLGGLVVLRLDTRRMTLGLIVVQGGALVVVALAQSHVMLMVGAAVFGVAIGNILMLQPLLIAEAFGVRSYGRVYAFNSLFSTIGVAGGPLLLGVLRDTFDYQVAFLLAAALCVFGVAALAAGGSSSDAKAIWS